MVLAVVLLVTIDNAATTATCRDEVTVSELGLLRVDGASQVQTDVKRQTAGSTKRGDAINLYLPAHVWEVSCSSGSRCCFRVELPISWLDGATTLTYLGVSSSP